MAGVGLDPETHADIIVRYGSLGAAAEKAKQDPRFAQAFFEVQFRQIYGDRAENAAASAEWDRLVAAWARVDAVEGEQPKQPRPRHRPPDPIPETTVKSLKWALAQRRASQRDPELTQEKIAGRLGLHRTRVQRAEALERVGWDLLRSHPEFSASDGLVRWPSATEAARVLASERAEN